MAFNFQSVTADGSLANPAVAQGVALWAAILVAATATGVWIWLGSRQDPLPTDRGRGPAALIMVASLYAITPLAQHVIISWLDKMENPGIGDVPIIGVSFVGGPPWIPAWLSGVIAGVVAAWAWRRRVRGRS